MHTLRERLPIEELFHLSAQLPLLIRGVFFEGYNPSNKPTKIKNRQKFFDVVSDNYGKSTETNSAEVTQAVLRVLYKRAGFAQMDIIRDLLPLDLRELFVKAKQSTQIQAAPATT